jgi:hypothetical protein
VRLLLLLLLLVLVAVVMQLNISQYVAQLSLSLHLVCSNAHACLRFLSPQHHAAA